MALPILENKRILLGVTGSIACYKAVDLASKLTQAGAQVDVILTAGAQRFLTPLTFQSVTGRRAYTDDDLWGDAAHVLHVGLAHGADLLVVAPITAHSLAKLAGGLSGDLLGVTALAATCPVLVAPAMDGGMFEHPATRANVATLRERGVHFVGPESGRLASGLVARGRMSEPTELFGRIRHTLSRTGPLRGCTVVVTAGGTREAVDPVRFLTNRSSGRQGYALAQAALDAGADVTLITTADLPAPTGAERISVESAGEMADAVLSACTTAHALLMAAAVADFRPARAADHKIKKRDGTPTLELAPNPDILAAVAQQRERIGKPDVVIGFAAETQDLQENARAKLAAKRLHMIVANDVSATDAGFAVPTNRVTFLSADGSVEPLPLLSKEEVSARVIERVIRALGRENETRGHDNG